MEHQGCILRSLLAQLEVQGAGDKEASNGIAAEFTRLKSQSTKYRTDKTFPSKTAEKQDNIKKNRYKDILPFDHTRVRLTLTTTKNDTDYINASFIKGLSGSRAYIATQGPLPHTVLDFFRMLWEYDIQVVVMACREFEMGRKKCERYWPQKQEQSFVCEPFVVYCDSEENKGDYVTRTLRVTYRGFSRALKQLHYINWPDHGVPDSIPPILDMLHEMRSTQTHDDVPICIHCSAGCGRTGALCVIDYTWNLLKKQMITPDFNIYDLVQNMRTQRPSLVQTKEQYELVHRTIKLLFERYLQSMDAQTCRNEVKAVPSAVTPDNESEFSDVSEELDLLLQSQHLLDEDRGDLPQHHTPMIPDLDSLSDLGAKGVQRDHLLQTFPEAVATGLDLLEGSRTSPETPVVEERTCDMPSLNPPSVPAVAAAICLMVEDPYFDDPMTSPTSEVAAASSTLDAKHWTFSPGISTPSGCLNDQTLELNPPASGTVQVNTVKEEPPPLPQRTPESYELAVDEEEIPPAPCERFMLTIPPNHAAEAVRELLAPVEQQFDGLLAVNRSRIGMSSEWSGCSKSATTTSQSKAKPWARSRSLKAKMTFTAPAAHPDLTSNATSIRHVYCPPLDPATPPLPPQTEESLTPPLPDRTPESFILPTEENQEKPTLCPQPLGVARLPRVGTSSEWDGTSQSKTFLGVVLSRSKSVRAKSSRQEPLTAVSQLTPPPVVVAGGGSAQVGQNDVNHRALLNAETPGSKSDKSTEKGMSRTRSLFFRHKQKPKSVPPPPPTQPTTPPPSYSTSGFKFGFGNRFGKPKGPRSYPETWF